MKFSIFIIFVFSLFGEEFQWEDKIVQVKTVSSFASEFKLFDKQRKILYESLLGFNQIKKKKMKTLDNKSILFLQVETSGEGFSTESLHYFIYENHHLNQGQIESVPSFSVKKKSKKLYIHHYKHWKPEFFLCQNEKLESNYGFPEIFEFKNGRFIKLKREDYLNELKKYYLKSEKKVLRTKMKFSKLLHFYLIQKKLKLNKEKNFLEKEIEYSCEMGQKKKIPFSKFIKKLG